MKYAQWAAAAVMLAGCAAVGVGEDKKVTGPLEVKMKSIKGEELDLAKAGLEATSRYLAKTLGPQGTAELAAPTGTTSAAALRAAASLVRPSA